MVGVPMIEMDGSEGEASKRSVCDMRSDDLQPVQVAGTHRDGSGRANNGHVAIVSGFVVVVLRLLLIIVMIVALSSLFKSDSIIWFYKEWEDGKVECVRQRGRREGVVMYACSSERDKRGQKQ